MIETGYDRAIEERIGRVRERVARAAARAGRAPGAVTVIAVTKTMPATAVRAAALAGIEDVGENRVQEADSKIDELSDLPGLRWHLIGHLQRNKARRAVERFAVIHSIDTLELARTVARHADEMGRRVEAFAQVNVSGEASKSGFSPEEFRQRADALARLPGLRWRGLMTMAPEEADTASLRAIFAATRSLAAEARQVFGDGWGALSMGMTGDFETAIEEGATHVRIGRAIFGERTAALQDGKP